MNQLIIICSECHSKYFGEYLETHTKSGRFGKYAVEVYYTQCVNCDEIVFETINKSL